MADKDIHFKGIPENLYGALQENVVTLLAMSETYCKNVMGSVPPELFSNRIVREIVVQCHNFITQYGKPPREHLVDLLEDKLEGEDGAVYKDTLSSIDSIWNGGFNEQFVANQLVRFIKGQNLKTAISNLIETAENSGGIDFEQASEIIEKYQRVSFEQFDPGLTLLDAARKLGTQDRSVPIVKYGIEQLDKAELGPARQELTLFMAPPKRGKTWFMLHAAKCSLLQRLKVVYITLEMSPELLAGRLLQSLFGMTKKDGDVALAGRFEMDQSGRLVGISSEELSARLSLSSDKGQKKIKQSFGVDGAKLRQVGRLSQNLIIQRFATGSLTRRQLEGYLDNLVTFHHFQPDVLIIDYADLMFIDQRNYRINLGMLYKELRGLAVDRNLALITASQSNRASIDALMVTEKHAAEDFSKIAISDVVFTYNQTPVERELSVARLFVAVARNGPDKWQVGISQAYSIGQFYTGSISVAPAVWQGLLPRPRAEDREVEED